jgi:uncharacterized protein YukE
MNQMIGANTTELRDMSAKIRSDADRLNQICIDLSGSFARTHWEGGDGDEIRADWQHRWSGQLRDVAGMLIAAANTLTKNAEEQDLASGTDSTQQAQSLWQRIANDTGLEFGEHDSVFEKVLTGLGIVDMGRSFLMDTETGQDLLKDGGKLLSNLAAKGGELGKLGKYGETASEAVGKFSESPFGRVVMANPEELAEGASFAEKANFFAGSVGPLAAFTVGFQVGKTIADPSVHNFVDLGFNIAEVASAEFPPLSIGLSIAQLAYDHPQVVVDIGKGIGNVATAVGNAEIKIGSDVVHGAADIASGGVNAVKHILHW